MKISLIGFALYFLSAAMSLASWQISCEGPEGQSLSFSESSITGKPLLSFHSTQMSLGLAGDQIAVWRSGIPLGFWVFGTEAQTPDAYRIRFFVPGLELGGGNLGDEKSFDARVVVEKGEDLASGAAIFRMSCTARAVAF
ncbi:MAG: hypothetical protein V4534_06495 [Myxococcota bacterium]